MTLSGLTLSGLARALAGPAGSVRNRGLELGTADHTVLVGIEARGQAIPAGRPPVGIRIRTSGECGFGLGAGDHSVFVGVEPLEHA
jgi:hypothetical protein